VQSGVSGVVVSVFSKSVITLLHTYLDAFFRRTGVAGVVVVNSLAKV